MNLGGRLQHEVGGDFKVPLPTFSGPNEDWPIWTVRFEACAALAGRSGFLDVAATQVGTISMTRAQPEAIRRGKIIYAVLLTKTEGSNALDVLQRDWQRGCEKWFVRVNSGQRKQSQGNERSRLRHAHWQW